MANICLRAWNWFRRFRKRCGYGVHSPSDFYLITFVIYEKLPFYAYEPLHKLRKGLDSLPHYREKVDKLLLRLVNHYRPLLLLDVGVGGGLQTRYMAAGNTQMEILAHSDSHVDKVESFLTDVPHLSYGKIGIEEMKRKWKELGTSDVMVHIGHTSQYRETFEALLPLAGERTCFVIGTPHANAAKKKWWKEVVADQRTGVTFDLYDVGFVFFDKKRIKEHRVVNFL